MNTTTQAPPAATGAAKTGKAASAAKSPPPRVIKAIHGSKVMLAQLKRNVWVVVAPDDYLFSDFEEPAVWANVSRDWRMFDRVEVIQSQRWSEGVVCDAGPGYAAVKMLQTIELPARRSSLQRGVPEGYEIRVAKPDQRGQFVVYRTKDGFYMSRNDCFESYEEALHWLLGLAIFRT